MLLWERREDKWHSFWVWPNKVNFVCNAAGGEWFSFIFTVGNKKDTCLEDAFFPLFEFRIGPQFILSKCRGRIFNSNLHKSPNINVKAFLSIVCMKYTEWLTSLRSALMEAEMWAFFIEKMGKIEMWSFLFSKQSTKAIQYMLVFLLCQRLSRSILSCLPFLSLAFKANYMDLAGLINSFCPSLSSHSKSHSSSYAGEKLWLPKWRKNIIKKLWGQHFAWGQLIESGPSECVFSLKKYSLEIYLVVSKIQLHFTGTRCQHLMGNLWDNCQCFVCAISGMHIANHLLFK